MSKDILLGGAFVASADMTGKTGLTVTIDVWRVAIADLAKSEIVTAGSATEIGDGAYAYRVASADLQTYYYFGILKTSDTSVVQKHVFAVNLDFADSPGLVTLIWNALTSGFSTAGSIGKLLADNINAAITSRLASASYTAPLDASGVRSAVGLATANLDTQIGLLATAAKLLSYIKSLARKDFAEDADIGGTYDAATDSLEAVKDAGASAVIADSDMTEIAGRVWNNTYAPTRTLTQSAASVIATVNGSLIAVYTNATWTISLTGLGSLSGYARLYFTVKDDPGAEDADALVQIGKYASGSGDGLLVLDAAALPEGVAVADGSLTIDDSGAGNVTILLKPAAANRLEAAQNLAYDIKFVGADGSARELSAGTLNIVSSVTRKIT